MYVIPDLKHFILDRVWAKAEKIADDLHEKHSKAKNLSVKDKEEIGLSFVEKVVAMFVKEGMAPQIHGLNGKTALWSRLWYFPISSNVIGESRNA